MKYLMNTYNGMALAETHKNADLKDGQKVTYVIEGYEYDGVIQSKTGHSEKRKWTCRYMDEDGLDNLSVEPVAKGDEIYFYLD